MESTANLYNQVVEKIISEQEKIIGPVAIDQARKVPGLVLNWNNHEVKVQGDEKSIVEKLVKQYEHLFGLASVEICKEAISKLNVPKDQLPSLLQ